jgi:hypothetical protein
MVRGYRYPSEKCVLFAELLVVSEESFRELHYPVASSNRFIRELPVNIETFLRGLPHQNIRRGSLFAIPLEEFYVKLQYGTGYFLLSATVHKFNSQINCHRPK